ncbi:MAG: 3-deoxy-D-manno-octulosonate 8-phosphate phosphatase phosphatase [Blastocatellia bacterium]|nr:3-deoxy-D-manno-octulosonate 8-phosphate phosphatase phosphatase [Blastocatellia bacterium]
MNSDHYIAEVERRARRIKLLLMDCDGVLTDGRLELLENGDEQKTFHARDGQGISLFHRAGLKTGIISGRTSSAVERRAQDLDMTYVRQYAKDKIAALDEILALANVSLHECAYIGDDLADIPVMHRVEFAVAVADAAVETRQAAHFVTEQKGGHGAVREVTDLILKAQGRWEELMKRFTG